MKVIDWLLRVSNGEIHEDTEFKINGEKIEGIKDLGEYKILSNELLNSTVEIIEEDKKIEEINEIEYYHQYDECWAKDKFYKDQKGNLVDEIIIDKVNEIIKAINEMREDK